MASRYRRLYLPRCGGFVILCQKHNKTKTALVRTHSGNWGFPKGKLEEGESLEECAYRELNEETGLNPNDINVIENVSFNEINRKGNPSVKLYLATTESLVNLKVYDEGELAIAQWIDIEKAYNILTLKNRKEILQEAVNVMSNYSERQEQETERKEDIDIINGNEWPSLS